MECSISFVILSQIPGKKPNSSLRNISEICLRNEITDLLGMASLKTYSVLILLRLDYHKQQATQ